MTEKELTSVWEVAIEPLKEQFAPSVFRAMFGNSHITGLSQEELLISVDNSMVRDFTRKYAEPVIVQRICEETKIVPQKITYAVRPKEKGKRAGRSESYNPRMFRNATAPVFELSGTDSEYEVDPHLAANLNPKYTFDTFIVGNKSRLSFAAAQAVAEKPGTLYNPLYIYGGVGLGKTHLMQAIGNHLIAKDAKKKVLYISCENFLNEFVASIKKGNPDAFKRKYRNIDVFFVDDIQFISGRDGVQEEFFHTFNALHQGNKQIVMTSDKRPKEIGGLEERLVSRFSMGMVTDIQMPDKDTREAILRAKCQEKGVNLPGHVLTYIADRIETNVRELEGALNTVIADLMSRNVSPTTEEVRLSLAKIITQQAAARKSPSSLIAELICDYYGISKEELLGPRRQQELVRPRQILMYLLKHEAGMTYPLIGREIGGRDHTTIMHGVEKITRELKKDPSLLSELHTIKDRFYEYKE